MWLRETARYLNTHSPPPRQRRSLIQFRSFDVRILVVSQYFWPENFRINDLVAGLVEKGHEVTVLTGHPNYPAGRFFPGHGWFRRTRERYHGAEVIRVPLVPRGAGGGIHLTLHIFRRIWLFIRATARAWALRRNFCLRALANNSLPTRHYY